MTVKTWRDRQSAIRPKKVVILEAEREKPEPMVIHRTCGDCGSHRPARLQRMIAHSSVKAWFWRCLPCHAKRRTEQLRYEAKLKQELLDTVIENFRNLEETP